MTDIPNCPRFPKIHSPFERAEMDGGYYVTGELNDDPDLSWYQSEYVSAVEKLEGTNCAAYVEDGRVQEVSTRMGPDPMNRVNPYTTNTNHSRIVRAVQNSARRGWFEKCPDGWNYGEVVGPKFQDNPYDLPEYLFAPFHRARRKYAYRSWGKYGMDFESVRDWFEDGLFSLFYADVHGTDLDTASVTNGTYVEGVVFHHPDADPVATGTRSPKQHHYAKVRRDMFAENDEWPGPVHDH